MAGVRLVVLVALAVRRDLEPVDPERLDAEHAADEANGAGGPRAFHVVYVRDRVAHHMRKTPNVGSGIGALGAAEMPRASTRRVASGAMMPASHRRAGGWVRL